MIASNVSETASKPMSALDRLMLDPWPFMHDSHNRRELSELYAFDNASAIVAWSALAMVSVFGSPADGSGHH